MKFAKWLKLAEEGIIKPTKSYSNSEKRRLAAARAALPVGEPHAADPNSSEWGPILPNQKYFR